MQNDYFRTKIYISKKKEKQKQRDLSTPNVKIVLYICILYLLFINNSFQVASINVVSTQGIFILLWNCSSVNFDTKIDNCQTFLS